MSDEIKKDEQVSEVKTDVSGESLPESELDKSVGGGQIKWTYTQQKRADGSTGTPSGWNLVPPPTK